MIVTGARRVFGQGVRRCGSCAVSLAVAAFVQAAWSQSTGDMTPVQRVEIVGTTPVSSAIDPTADRPINGDTIRDAGAGMKRSLDLTERLEQDLGSVNLNDTTGNAFQPDVNVRGFTASPVLGTPQGLSVFFNGVRVNEAFGDTVNWDLIPQAAVADITLIPGSNPSFGLNSLGGSLSIVTRNGFTDPGSSIAMEGGSFGRYGLDIATGAHGQHLGYFLAASGVDEAGWGEHDPSRVRQFFASVGLRDARSRLDVDVVAVHNRLEGSQTLPLSMLSDPRQAYTWPDWQKNRLAFVILRGSRVLANGWSLAGNVYERTTNTDAFNSNVNDDFDPSDAVGAGNQPTGNVLDDIDQHRSGGSVELSSDASIAHRSNHFSLGANRDTSRTDFFQSSQEAGSARDTRSDEPVVLGTALHATAPSWGLFASDTLAITPLTSVTLSARGDHASVDLQDRLGTALNGQHRFFRVNPAVAMSHAFNGYSGFLSSAQGMRVPTPVELTCANPDAPCALPNAFSSDPALKPVVSQSFESGLRSVPGAPVIWSVSLFRTALRNDIQFVSSGGGATSTGYFRNVGQTRRQGFELAGANDLSSLSLSAHYTYLAATFESPFIISSPDNSAVAALSCATCTDIAVKPGDRIPGIPHHILKVRANWRANPDWTVGANVIVQSSSYARGDESNQDSRGPVPGYALLGLDSRLRLGAGWEVFMRATNVLNRRFSSYGTLGQNVFTASSGTFDTTGSTWRPEQFRSVGAPFGIWIGLSCRFAGVSTAI